MIRKSARIDASVASAAVDALGVVVWVSANFAERWYADALREASEGQNDYDSIRREIVFAACFAESYIFEWARRIVGVEDINDYFPLKKSDNHERYRRSVTEKWKCVPSELHTDRRIAKKPQLDLGGLGLLKRYRDGLIHAGASRPATHSQPQESKPFPTKRMLEARGSGWAIGIVVDLVERLHAELGTPKPRYLVRP